MEEDMRRMMHVHVDFCGVFDSCWLAEHAITCNAYAPGRVGTAMWDEIDAKVGARRGGGRWGYVAGGY